MKAAFMKDSPGYEQLSSSVSMGGQANPQLEDGYTRISNELLEAICKYDFTGLQMRILMLFIRSSYGYGKREAAFSLEYIQEKLQIPKRSAQRSLKSLTDANILQVIQKASRSTPRIMMLNKKYNEWDISGDQYVIPKSESGDTQVTKNRVTQMTRSGDRDVTPRGDLAVTHKRKTKENINKGCQTRARVCEERVSGPCPTPTLESISGYCQSEGLRFVDARRFFEHYERTKWTTKDGRPVEDWKKLLRKWDKQDREKAAREAAGGQPECRKVKSTGFSNFEQRDYDFDELERQLLGSQGIGQEV